MLEPLFDAELDYQPGMPPLTSKGDGALVGSGDGAVRGPKLTGTLEWTLFEQAGSTMCAMARVATITTGDSRYSWPDGALALWEGEFNEVTHHARYTAFI